MRGWRGLSKVSVVLFLLLSLGAEVSVLFTVRGQEAESLELDTDRIGLEWQVLEVREKREGK